MQFRIFIFIYFIYLGLVSTLHPRTVKRKYLDYVIRVVNYIRVQEGWNSIKHLHLNHDVYKNLSIENVFAQKVDKNNILNMFSIVVHLLNYKYTEILRSYVELVTLILKECEKYSAANLFKEFINCTQHIEQKVKNSMIMFNDLYQVMTFMSSFDTKWLFKNISGIPFVMVEEIYFAYHYTNTMKISDQSFFIDENGNFIPENATSVLANIKKILDKLDLMVEKDQAKNCILVELSERIDYQLLFEEQYLHYKSTYCNLNIIDFMLNAVYEFCMNTIKNDYENLGFKEIINPLLYKRHSLYLPQIDFISQSKGIENLNIILNAGNWKILNYLYIKYNNQVLSANRVLRDQANNINFHLKKQYFTQLIRCRFYDLLKTFSSHLCGILELCKHEKTSSDKFSNPHKYIECLKNFHMTTRNIQHFLNYLKMAMEKLQKAYIWCENGTFYCLGPIKNIVENTLYLIEVINLRRDEFSDYDTLNLKRIADNYFEDAQYLKASLLSILNNVSRVHKKHCLFDGKPFHSKRDVLEHSNSNAYFTNIANPTINPVTSYQQACADFNRFCEDFIRIEYRNLGFDKIN
ncbi:uncharacterized protein LOC126907271 [Daktulosphaira vitifoliae]|uniref:uncharacterized protein LOC126907271 n=1 Tax=Daktulosphaira vitifoliae TaxID=58002 RepID=UPI0021AA41C5|nr:uncharacterized protein LOC126907271 [Daktulosphaira vitifoliae]